MKKKIKRFRVRGTNEQGWISGEGFELDSHGDVECPDGAGLIYSKLLEIEYEEVEQKPVWHEEDGTCNEDCPFVSRDSNMAIEVEEHNYEYIYCDKYKEPMAYAIHICPAYVQHLKRRGVEDDG